jgi:mycofactocin system creatininase family protein
MIIPTSGDIAISHRIVVLPLGSWEQHGPHLPLHTDTVIVDTVVDSALGDTSLGVNTFLRAPTLPITASDEHDGFSGGLSSGTEALVATVVAIARSASWARGICIVNGHGGNISALGEISSALEYENIPAHIWSLPSYVGGDMHAGHTETSLLLHIAPELVRSDLIEAGATEITSHDIDLMKVSGVKAVSPNGVLGDPRQANADHGRKVLALYTESLITALRACAAQWPVPSA